MAIFLETSCVHSLQAGSISNHYMCVKVEKWTWLGEPGWEEKAAVARSCSQVSEALCGVVRRQTGGERARVVLLQYTQIIK